VWQVRTSSGGKARYQEWYYVEGMVVAERDIDVQRWRCEKKRTER
jgi:hypothetical protein